MTRRGRLGLLLLVLALAVHGWATDEARLAPAPRAARAERLAFARALDEALDEGVARDPLLAEDYDALTVSAVEAPAPAHGRAGVAWRWVLVRFRPGHRTGLRVTAARAAGSPLPLDRAARAWLARPASELVALLSTHARWAGPDEVPPRLLALVAAPPEGGTPPTIADALRVHGFTHLVLDDARAPAIVPLDARPRAPTP